MYRIHPKSTHPLLFFWDFCVAFLGVSQQVEFENTTEKVFKSMSKMLYKQIKRNSMSFLFLFLSFCVMASSKTPRASRKDLGSPEKPSKKAPTHLGIGRVFVVFWRPLSPPPLAPCSFPLPFLFFLRRPLAMRYIRHESGV
jgi:hypothetical protein